MQKFNPEDYKEIMMKKHNLSEEKWNEVVELVNLFQNCDNIGFIPTFPFLDE
ncbi:MAG: hypothetical protein IKT41_01690 [Clostridia bacterium]|nr:hypothetical protein [Clostridia bacterium]